MSGVGKGIYEPTAETRQILGEMGVKTRKTTSPNEVVSAAQEVFNQKANTVKEAVKSLDPEEFKLVLNDLTSSIDDIAVALSTFGDKIDSSGINKLKTRSSEIKNMQATAAGQGTSLDSTSFHGALNDIRTILKGILREETKGNKSKSTDNIGRLASSLMAEKEKK